MHRTHPGMWSEASAQCSGPFETSVAVVNDNDTTDRQAAGDARVFLAYMVELLQEDVE